MTDPCRIVAVVRWTVLGLALAQTSLARAVEPAAANREVLERQFAERLTGSTLEGYFTDSAHDADAPLSKDRYTLGEVRKLSGNQWQFQTRIQYGKHDVTIPLTLPVEWAGDTPVIVVDKVAIPGLGVFSARVLFHGERYAGFWEGANHGGHLFGVVKPADDAKKTGSD
jgi:hypothetical protein